MPDYLANALEALTTLDGDTAEAIRLLCLGNQVPVDKVVLKRKQFEIGGKSYEAKLSQPQWEQILAVVGQGTLAVLVKVRKSSPTSPYWSARTRPRCSPK